MCSLERGPLQGREIHYIDGTDESYRNTLVLTPQAEDQWLKSASSMRAHKADDTRASWLKLLTALQKTENQSRYWDEREGIRGALSAPDLPIVKPKYGITVALQRKLNSWDFMPQTVNKV